MHLLCVLWYETPKRGSSAASVGEDGAGQRYFVFGSSGFRLDSFQQAVVVPDVGHYGRSLFATFGSELLVAGATVKWLE